MPDTTPRRWLLARFLTVLGVVALSLTIVMGPAARPAAAFVTAFAPVAIRAGAGLFTVPLRNIAVGGAMVRAGTVGLGALGVGTTAWATQDSWMPLLDNGVTAGEATYLPPEGKPVIHGGTQTQQTLQCNVSIGNPRPNQEDPHPQRAYKVDVQWGPSTTCPSASKGLLYELDRVVCRDSFNQLTPGSGTTQAVSFSTGGTTVSGATGTQLGASIPNLCAVGSALVYASIRAILTRAGEYKWSTWITIPGGGWLPGEHSTITEVECERPDGSTFKIDGGETGQPNRVAIPSCIAAEPDSIPRGGDVRIGPKGFEQPALTFSNPGVKQEYGDCFTMAGLVCQVKVHYNNEPCNSTETSCHDWQRTWNLNPNLIRCRFGPYTVAMANCEPLKYSYVPNGRPTVITTPTYTDLPNPGTNTDPPTNPNPNPNPTPGPTPGPGTGVGPVPNPDGPSTNPDPSVDPNSQNCLGAAAGWNPVDWVFVPVKCAIIWAFVPKTPLNIRIDRIGTTFANRAPFSWVAGLAGLPAVVPRNNCPDWRVTVGGSQRNVVCGHSYTEAIRAMRPVLTGFMAALAFWPLIRSTAYASFPVLKPTPSGGR